MALTKITAKFYAPMYAAFDRQVSDALLRRDVFLDRMIAAEIPHLREDLRGKRLSSAAHNYISQSLKRMGGKNTPPLKQVSLAVASETAKALNKVVVDHNLVRDSFLNLLIALLRSSDPFLKSLGLPLRVGDWPQVGTESMPTSPMKAMEEIQSDPLVYLRDACEYQYSCGLYTLPLRQEWHGLSCYLPDEAVPGTAENQQKTEDEQEFLKIRLDDFESGIPTMTQEHRPSGDST